MKQRIANFDQNVKLEQVDKQTDGIISIALSYVPKERMGAFFERLNRDLPEIRLSKKQEFKRFFVRRDE